MVGWTRRAREADREMALWWAQHRRWWAKATPEQRAAWIARQQERSRYEWLWGLAALAPFLFIYGFALLLGAGR